MSKTKGKIFQFKKYVQNINIHTFNKNNYISMHEYKQGSKYIQTCTNIYTINSKIFTYTRKLNNNNNNNNNIN